MQILKNPEFPLGWPLGAVWDPLLDVLDRSWEALGPPLGALGAPRAALGAVLGRSGRALGPLLALLGRTCVRPKVPEPSWD